MSDAGSKTQTPSHWPEGVTGMNWDNLAKLVVHERTGDLYWDGKRVETKFKLGGKEAWLAWAVGIATASMGLFDAIRFFMEITT